MKLQRAVWVLAAMNVALMAVVATQVPVALGAKQPAPEAIRAQSFEFVDSAGTVRASIKAEPEGEVIFRLIDGDGTIRVKLGAGKDGSGLALMDDETEPSIHMMARPDGPSILMRTKDGEQHPVGM